MHEDDDDSGDEIDLEKLKSFSVTVLKEERKRRKRMSQMSKEELGNGRENEEERK